LKEYIVAVPAKPKNSSTKESAIITLILCLTVIKTQLSSVEYIKSSISHNWHYSLQSKNEQIGLVPSKKIYIFCLYLLFSMEPYFFKIDDHISMLLSLFVHHSLEGLDLLIELSNLWPTTVKSAHAYSTTNIRAQISETRLQQQNCSIQGWPLSSQGW
jgi:hypothetical protein